MSRIPTPDSLEAQYRANLVQTNACIRAVQMMSPLSKTPRAEERNEAPRIMPQLHIISPFSSNCDLFARAAQSVVQDRASDSEVSTWVDNRSWVFLDEESSVHKKKNGWGERNNTLPVLKDQRINRSWDIDAAFTHNMSEGIFISYSLSLLTPFRTSFCQISIFLFSVKNIGIARPSRTFSDMFQKILTILKNKNKIKTVFRKI